MTSIRRRITSALTLTTLLAVSAVIAFAARGPGEANAHAVLIRADPAVNGRLLQPPSLVTAFFTEPLDSSLSSLSVLNGAGERVDTGTTSYGPEDEQMGAALPEGLAPGFYQVAWKTLSTIDGHLLEGSYPFTVLNTDGSEPTGQRPDLLGSSYSGGGADIEDVTTKWAGLAFAVMLTGSIAFTVWVVRPASKDLSDPWKQRTRDSARRRLALIAWPCAGLLALTGLAEIVLRSREAGGLEIMDDVLSTFWGERWVQRQLVLGAIMVALGFAAWLWQSGRARISESALWVALAGGFGYLLLTAMVSHGGAIPGSFWAVAADFAHLAASAVWVGMLAQLGLFLLWTRREVPDGERSAVYASHLQRFSTLAATAVAIIVASGAANSLSQIPDLEAMIDTAYGRALTVKLIVTAALLAVAGVNAFYLRPRTVREGGGSKRLAARLIATVRAEIALAVIVLLVAAVLVQYTTARQERDADALTSDARAVIGFEEVVQAEDMLVSLTVSPNSVGANSYRVSVFGETASLVQRVRLRFAPADASFAPSEVILEPAGPSQYRAVGPFFTQAGAWDVEVDIRRSELDDVSTLVRVDVTALGATDGGRFSYPLLVGSWAAVGAVAVLLAALLASVWATQWPGLPVPTPRLLRVGSGAGSVVGFALLVSSIWPGATPTTGNPVEATDESIAMGRQLFGNNCTQCHGVLGRGDGPLADTLPVPPADFRQHVPFHSEKFFFGVIGNGLGDIMPAFGEQLTEEERWHLINFLQAEFGEPDAELPTR